MFDISEFEQKEKKLHHRLTWALFVDQSVILNKTGTFQTTIGYQGKDVESLSNDELSDISKAANKIYKRLGTGWAIFNEIQRTKISEYPNSNFTTFASGIVDNEQKELFLEADQYQSQNYLTLVFMPPSESVSKLESIFMNDVKKEINYHKYIDYFKTETDNILELFKNICVDARKLTDDETLTYLHSTISTNRHRIKSPDTPLFLDYLLTDQEFTGGFEPALNENHIGVIGLKGYPKESKPEILTKLNDLCCEYRWTTRYICLDKEDAVKEIEKYASKWFSKRKSMWAMVKEAFFNEEDPLKEDSAVVTKGSECKALSEVVSTDLTGAGYYTANVVVWDSEREILDEKKKAVINTINGADFTAVDERANAVQAWFGTLPGNCYANIRRPLISSLNLAELMSLNSAWAGLEKNNHLNGPPLYFARTNNNTPFRGVNHVKDVGHLIVFGPTGNGKTALLNFMVNQFLRYPNAQIISFDKDYSSYCTTILNGGVHYDIGRDPSISFQPLRYIDDDMERAWALGWMSEILAQENITVNPEIKNEINDTLKSLSTSPPDQRTITGFIVLVQNKDIRNALAQYALGGIYGDIFDSSSDHIAENRWITFEMDYLMNNFKGAVWPLLSYLFHAIEKRFDKDIPTFMGLEECWFFLDNPVFQPKIKDWLKVLRKKGVGVGFSTQQPADILDSPISLTIIDSCKTRYFLPNKRANSSDENREVYKKFGLTDRQIEIIQEATPNQEYYYDSENGTRLFNLKLQEKSLALCASDSETDREYLKTLMGLPETEMVEKFLTHKEITL